MKTQIAIFLASLLLFGCSQEKFETKTMSWDTKSLFYTNQNLVIFAKGGPIQTNVDSLDQAANILGQYGWEFVNSDTENGEKVYHMKRRAQKTGDFYLSPNVHLNN
ncbi:MAG: hypothetical protein ABSC89_02005 [Verrucomicrobiota bacterium]|jgi:hypothetical protein